MGTPPAPSSPLRRFFSASSLGLPDPDERLVFYNTLASRLPARGRPRYVDRESERMRAFLRRQGTPPSLRERLAALARDGKRLQLTPKAVEANEREERAIAHAVANQEARRDECARFLQAFVLRWLYLPAGAMVHRAMRELDCVTDG